jgi:ammonium transporter family
VDKISAGDTSWVLASAALVTLMTPGLGFFYGSLVRRKNVLSTVIALVGSWFVLPAAPRTIETTAHAVADGLPTAA